MNTKIDDYCDMTIFQNVWPNRYLETQLRIIERLSDKIRLCKWRATPFSEEFPRKSNEAVICAISVFPPTKTLVFKSNPLNPNANPDLPILLNDDPEIILDETTQQKRGYSGTFIIYI